MSKFFGSPYEREPHVTSPVAVTVAHVIAPATPNESPLKAPLVAIDVGPAIVPLHVKLPVVARVALVNAPVTPNEAPLKPPVSPNEAPLKAPLVAIDVGPDIAALKKTRTNDF